MSGQGPRKSVREMTGPEMESLRVDLFRKARELGHDVQASEDIASEAILCFYRWTDGGEGAQLSHAIIHARGKLYGWKGTGKAARARFYHPERSTEEMPDDVLNRSTGNPESAWCELIDAKRALALGDATLVHVFALCEFSLLDPKEVAHRYGLRPARLKRQIELFRRYLKTQ